MPRRPLRVLCLTSWYPPHHFGGYEASCRDVMRRLAASGDHVEILTSDHRHEDVADEDATPVARVHRTLQLYFRDGDLWTPSPRARFGVERHNQRALSRALDQCRPDVVSVWHVGALSLGLLASVRRRDLPVVLAISDDWTTYAHRLDAWTRAWARRPKLASVVQRVTGIPSGMPDLDDIGPACFISELTRQRAAEKSPWQFGVNGLVYSGFDYEHFSAGPAASTPPATVGMPGTQSGTELLYVGRLDPRKGIRTLLSALALLPDVRLVVDSRAAEVDRRVFDSWCDELGVSGRVTVVTSTRGELPARYRVADACVFPSEWEEPFGLVPLEAMAAGTPVVASGVGGSAEFLVDGENCVIFQPGDAPSLARSVRRVVGDPALRDHLVATGHRTAQHFDADHLASSFDAWHRFAVDPDSAQRPGDRPLPPPRDQIGPNAPTTEQ